ncbi:MAG TPA: FGGY family carbohydrate kinase [Microbacteriaceae bacterium]|nr:FGGY family carbohydrate kinase [Microbacteriaceae bacterium]
MPAVTDGAAPVRVHRITPRAHGAGPSGVRTTRTLVAGIDSAAGGCTVVVRDAATGERVRSGRAAAPAGAEADPHAWWQALLDAIEASGGFADVSAFGIGAADGQAVTLDAEGHLVRAALVGDERGFARAALDLVAEVGRQALAARVGSIPAGSHPLAKLRWLRDGEPENAGRVEAVALRHDWLMWRLRGFGPRDEMPNGLRLEELVTDRSGASGTGYWNPATGKWDHDLFGQALGRPAIKPRVMPPDAWGGESWKMPSHGIKSERVISIGGTRPAIAALGLGLAPGDIMVSLGSGAVSTMAPAPVVDETGAIRSLADAAGGFLPTVVTPGDASALAGVARLLGVTNDGLARLAGAARPGAGGVVFTPRTAEFHAPDATAKTPENLARAALEGVLCTLAAAADALATAGLPARRVIVIGPGAGRGVVQQATAQVFGLPVAVPQAAGPSSAASSPTAVRAAGGAASGPAAARSIVADGAAAQAVWAKTHRRASWHTPLTPEREADPRPEVRDQFSRWASRASSAPAR